MSNHPVNRPARRFKELKQKQKARISDVMYRETNWFFEKNGHMPETENEIRLVARRIYDRVSVYRVPPEEIELQYLKKRERIILRLETQGLPEHLLPETKSDTGHSKSEKKKLKKSRKKKSIEAVPALEQDDNFFYIAGHTSGGAPYGVTWEEMGLEPWETLEEYEENLID